MFNKLHGILCVCFIKCMHCVEQNSEFRLIIVIIIIIIIIIIITFKGATQIFCNLVTAP